MTVDDINTSKSLPHTAVKDPTSIKGTDSPSRILVSLSDHAPASDTRPQGHRWDRDNILRGGTQSNDDDKKQQTLAAPVLNNASSGCSSKLPSLPPKESSSGLDNLALAAVAVPRAGHAPLGGSKHDGEHPMMHHTTSARQYTPAPREVNVKTGPNFGNTLAPMLHLRADPIARLPGLFAEPGKFSHAGDKGAAKVTVYAAADTDAPRFRLPPLENLELPRPPLDKPPAHGVAFYYGGSSEGASNLEMERHYQKHMRMNWKEYQMHPSAYQGQQEVLLPPNHLIEKCQSQNSRDLLLPKTSERRFTAQPANPTAANNNTDPRNFQLNPCLEHQRTAAKENVPAHHRISAEKYQEYQNQIREIFERIDAGGRSNAPPQLQNLAPIRHHHQPDHDRNHQPAHRYQPPGFHPPAPPRDAQPLSQGHHQQPSHHDHQPPARDHHQPSVHDNNQQPDRHAASRSSAPPRLQEPLPAQHHHQNLDTQQPPTHLHHRPPAHHPPPQENQPPVQHHPQQHHHQPPPPGSYPPALAPFQDLYRHPTDHYSPYPNHPQPSTHHRTRSDPLHHSRLERRRRTRTPSPRPYSNPLTHIIPANNNLQSALTAHDSFDAHLKTHPPAHHILRTVTPAHYELSAQLRAKRAQVQPEPGKPPTRHPAYHGGPVEGRRSEREGAVRGVGGEGLRLEEPWVRAVPKQVEYTCYSIPANLYPQPQATHEPWPGQQLQPPPRESQPPRSEPQERPYYPFAHEPRAQSQHQPSQVSVQPLAEPYFRSVAGPGSVYGRHHQSAYSPFPQTAPHWPTSAPRQNSSAAPPVDSQQESRERRDPSTGEVEGSVPVKSLRDGRRMDFSAILNSRDGLWTELKASYKSGAAGRDDSAAVG